MELDGIEIAGAGLSIVASDEVLEALSRIGRTEDIRFSPDQRRLVLAGYVKNVCLILNLEVDRSAARPVIRIHDHVEIRSKSLNLPHGLDFIGERRLVVANRRGHLSLFTLPDSWPESRVLDLAGVSPENQVFMAGVSPENQVFKALAKPVRNARAAQ